MIAWRCMLEYLVHPHGRGDNFRVFSRFLPPIGSPPRAWGQLIGGGLVAILDGSPPRAWGQRRIDTQTTKSHRFTPTGVGTTPILSHTRLLCTVHPHGRGDNSINLCNFGRLSGSPPRAWGQPAPMTSTQQRRRFTPTGVGTTTAMMIARPTQRFTPTGVGTTDRRPRRWRLRQVHPHGRGDNHGTSEKVSRRGGSPPRAWGQQFGSFSYPDQFRFTPTGVGTTWSSCRDEAGCRRFTPTGVGTTGVVDLDAVYMAVHPHGRGDNKGVRL